MKYSMVLKNSIRSYSYIYHACKEGYPPEKVYLMSDSKEDFEVNLFEKLEVEPQGYFELCTSIVKFLNVNQIDYSWIKTESVNADSVIEALSSQAYDFIIYSGFAGEIVSEKLLDQFKFIHMHCGDLPYFRGSTTLYYSILDTMEVCATSILMAKEIDQGKTIEKYKEKVPVLYPNLDYIYDSYIRSKALVRTLQNFLCNGGFSTHLQSHEEGRDYYIIHPVLKHIAMLRLENRETKDGKSI